MNVNPRRFALRSIVRYSTAPNILRGLSGIEDSLPLCEWWSSLYPRLVEREREHELTARSVSSRSPGSV